MMAEPSKQPPGNGFLGWLGRQVGYVTKAVKTDVTLPVPSKTVYRDCKIEEQVHPEDPGLTLRRTVIDEIVVSNKNPNDEVRNPNQ